MTYADSSVIVKRYYQEPGSERMRERSAILSSSGHPTSGLEAAARRERLTVVNPEWAG
jgi:predicted nucleic acid-binding protein